MKTSKIRKLTPDDVTADAKKNIGNTIFHATEKWLSENYNLRFNEISLVIEYKRLNSEKWLPVNEDELYVKANKDNINVPINKLVSILKSDFVEKYNPFQDYFMSLDDWDGETDYISKYASYLKLAPGENEYFFLTEFKKWLVRVVKCSTITGYFNKQAFILTDQGKHQNMGKTTWTRSLCPVELQKYFAENLTGNEKDDLIQLCKNFIINLDELKGLDRKGLNRIKSSMSKNQINARLPFAKNNVVIDRVASFIGSTNETTFLFDSTGSVRWICFEIEAIDRDYSSKEDINKLWAQAYSLSKDSTFNSEMSREDLLENEKRNQRFYAQSPEEELILRHFKKPTYESDPNVVFMTTTEIISEIPNPGIRIYPNRFGKSLQGLSFNRVKRNGVYGYLLIKI